MDESNDNELECRVCRSGSELPHRPLRAPCLCSGSIGLVHQDCLEAWLDHSQKDTCELCGLKYRFSPQYAEDTPSVIPLTVVFQTTLKKFKNKIIPYAFRVVSALVVWLLIVPLTTCLIYRMWMRLDTLPMIAVEDGWKKDAVSGVVLTAFIILTFVVMMSFADFLRFHGVPEEALQRPQDVANMPNQHVHHPIDPPQPPVDPIPDNIVNANAHQPAERNDNNANINRQPQNIGFEDNRTENVVEINAENMNEYISSLVDVRTMGPEERHTQSGDPVLSSNIALPAAVDLRNIIDRDVNDIIEQESKLDSDSIGNPDVLILENPPTLPEPLQLVDVNAGLVPERNDDEEEMDVDEVHEDNDDEEEDEDDEDEDDGHDDDDFNNPGNPAGANGGDGADVHVAVDELLGLRGLTHLLRNALWLLAFNAVYIGLFAAMPMLIGQAFSRWIELMPILNRIGPLLKLLFPQVNLLLSEIITSSSSARDAMQLSDIFLIALGYITVFMTVFALNEIVKPFRQRFTNRIFSLWTRTLMSLTNIIKVGILLFLRVFFLPLLLGVVILWCANIFLAYPTSDWVSFVASNVTGAGSLAWVAGISYMVTTTLSVLQLREILHPQILARYIRPQEPHVDLLVSLMTESCVTHSKRIIASLLVYLFILFLFFFLPMIISRKIILPFFSSAAAATTDGSSSPLPITIKLNFRYYIPQIQIPVELAMAHLTFLTILDKKKNLIGRVQYAWLIYICSILGMSRYILPHPRKRVENSANANNLERARPIAQPNVANNQQQSHQATDSNNANENRREEFILDDDGQPVVGPPLRRPPAGWDARTNRNTSRWAWGHEQPSELERLVAPRVAPERCVFMTVLLCLLTWLVVFLFVLFIVFVPLLLGRSILWAMQMPNFLMHDPLCLVIGSFFCGMIFSMISQINKRAVRKYIRSVRSLPLNIIAWVIQLVVAWLFIEIAVGVLIYFEMTSTFGMKDLKTVWFYVSSYIKGSTLLGVSLALVYLGTIEKLLNRLDFHDDDFEMSANNSYDLTVSIWRKLVGNLNDAGNELNDPNDIAGNDNLQRRQKSVAMLRWTQQITSLLTQPIEGFENGRWNNEEQRLQSLWTLLVWPLLVYVVFSLYLKIIGSTVLSKLVMETVGPYVYSNSVMNENLMFQLLKFSAHMVYGWEILPWMKAFVSLWTRKLYDSVRDEAYLVGRRLMDVNNNNARTRRS